MIRQRSFRMNQPYTYRAKVGCPDAFRGIQEKRAYLGERVRGLPLDFPKITDSAGTKVPAIVELRGLCRDVSSPDADGVITGVWSVYAGPHHHQIDSYMMAEETVAAYLRTLLESLLSLGAERHSSWQVFYSGVCETNEHGVQEPFVRVTFSHRPPRMIEAQDEKIMRRYLWLPLAYNWLAERVGWQRWLPPEYQKDIWWNNPEANEAIHQLIEDQATPLAKKVWQALQQDRLVSDELQRQGHRAFYLNKTRVGVRTSVRNDPRNKHTRMLKRH